MSANVEARDQWSSKFGFIMATAGSAVGLANIWAFPFRTGQNGGAAFVLIYLLCILFICLPFMFAELVLGHHKQKILSVQLKRFRRAAVGWDLASYRSWQAFLY